MRSTKRELDGLSSYSKLIGAAERGVLTAELSMAAANLRRMTADRDQFRRAQAAWAAGRRMVARRERPCYRVADTGDGATVHIVELPWIAPITATRATAIDQARTAIAAWLDVQLDAFDVEHE